MDPPYWWHLDGFGGVAVLLADAVALFGYTTDDGVAPRAGPEEERDDRQRRRFDRYRALGADRVQEADGTWKASGSRGALAALAREEAAAGRPYHDPRDVSRDLDAEADRRRASRAMPRG